MKTLEEINNTADSIGNLWRSRQIELPEFTNRMKELENEVKLFALETSRQNPGKYIIARFAFHAFVYIRSRIWIDDPGSSYFGGYFRNGELKPFTNGQKIRYQNSGITCQ